MRTDLRDELDGTPILQAIESFGSDPDDFQTFSFPAIGQSGFGLEGEELNEFVRRCVKAALRNGCVPVEDRPDGNWRPTYAYGITDEAIAANMTKAWRALGRDPEWGELMFSWEEWIDPEAYVEWTARRNAVRGGA